MLGVLNFTFFSEERGEGGFKRVNALLLEGTVEDVSLSWGVVWIVTGLLNGLEKKRSETKKPTVCHFAHRDPHRPPHRCIYTHWRARHDIRPSLPPQGARDPSED
jgi:hypothetical protein